MNTSYLKFYVLIGENYASEMSDIGIKIFQTETRELPLLSN